MTKTICVIIIKKRMTDEKNPCMHEFFSWFNLKHENEFRLGKTRIPLNIYNVRSTDFFEDLDF